ncbi:MAG: hypothetical protein ACT4PX_05910 [Actinomycetota bacterium]
MALAGGIALAAVLAPAGPALAAAPTISISSPGAGQQLDSRSVTVAARVTMSNGDLVDTIRFRLQQLDSERPDITASRPPAADVSFPVDLPYNGRYKATITATGRDRPLDLNGDESSSATREFSVAAPPASPTGVKVAVDTTARTVVLTWKANTEPDMLFYVVQRAKGTSAEFTVLGKVTEPKFSDASTAEAGGEYRYQVIAVRKGLEEGKGLNSDPSELTADSTATVPDPPPPPTTAPAPGTTAAGTAAAPTAGATATTAAPKTTVPANSPGALTTSGTVDLNGFTSVQSQAVRRPPRVVEPDTGFQSTLPFAPRPGGEEGEVAEDGAELGEVAADSPQFRELGQESEGADRQRTMAFLAAGLLSTVLLMHVLWVKSEVKRVPLEALIPEGPLPAARIDDVRTGKVKPARARGGRAKGPAAVPEWFIPERLGMDEAGPEREKVATGS